RIARLLRETEDAQTGVYLNHAELIGIFDRHGQGCDAYSRLAIEVEFDHLTDIHPVDVVGAKDRDKVGLEVVDEVEVLEDCVGGTLIPVLAEAHLRRDGQDELVMHDVAELPAVLEMLDEGLRAPLHQDVDGKD